MIEQYDSMIAFHLFGIPINWTIASTWLVMALLMLVSWLATRGLKSDLKVSRWQTALEVVVQLIRDQVREMANDNPSKYLPLVGTFFLFIATCNLLSIFPWFRQRLCQRRERSRSSCWPVFRIMAYATRDFGDTLKNTRNRPCF